MRSRRRRQRPPAAKVQKAKPHDPDAGVMSSAMHASALSKDRANAAKTRAEAAHETAAQVNTLFAPNLSHRKETTSKEAANEAVNAP